MFDDATLVLNTLAEFFKQFEQALKKDPRAIHWSLSHSGFPPMTTNDYDLIRLMLRTIKLEVVCSKQEVEIWLLDTTKPFCLGTENSIRQINAFATARGFKVKEMIKL
jgi:hypothetical protein